MLPPDHNLAASVHQRLLNKARASGRPFNELLQHFAIERFLYRLSISPKGTRFVLKGALMLFVWDRPGSRPTLDIDLSGRISNDPDEVISVMRAACSVPAEPDGLTFEPGSVNAAAIIEDAEYKGIRTHLQGSLGRAKIFLQIDIGFGDPIVPEATDVVFPALLDFPAAHFKGYSMESTIAEKLHAMVRLGVINSRMKDFYDIWLLSEAFRFDGPLLGRAVTETFANRATPIEGTPALFEVSFSQDNGRQTQWRAFITKSQITNAPQSFEEVMITLNAFLKPVWVTLSSHHLFVGEWEPGGPWRTSV
jgi:hypothetical protein